MDEYSDMVAVAKPVVYVTVGELVNTHRVRGRSQGLPGHRRAGRRAWGVPDGGLAGLQLPPFCALQLLLEHQDHIAPDPGNPLHELLEDLGELPTVPDLVGACCPRASSLGWVPGSWVHTRPPSPSGLHMDTWTD